MSQNDSDNAPSTVCDVMAYFSEEDWKKLHDWQKELYKNVMNEIHHALMSLGPLIATSVSSSKDKRKDQSSLEQLDSGPMNIIEPSPDGEVVIPRFTLNIKEEEETYSVGYQNSDKSENINSPVGDKALISRLSVSVKEEDEIYSMDQQDTERRESINSPICYPDAQPRDPVIEIAHSDTQTDVPGYGYPDAQRRVPVIEIAHSDTETDVPGYEFTTSSNELETNFMGHVDPQSGKPSTLPSSGFSSHNDESDVIFVNRVDHFRGGDCGITSNSVGFSTHSNELEASYMDHVEHVDARGGECSASPKSGLLTSSGWELRKKQMRKGSDNRKLLQSLKSLNKSADFTKQLHEKHWQGTYKCGQCGKSFIHKLDIINHHRMHNIKKAYPGIEHGSRSNQWSTAFKPNGIHSEQRSSTWTQCDKKVDGTQILSPPQKRHSEIKLCKCGQCGNSFYQSSNMAANQRVNRAQQSTCGKCERSASLTRNLTPEQGQLLTDRPYVCSECGKTFKNSQTLITHRRIHTGEKPYPCGKCGKNFRQLSHLVTHQRIHTGEKPFVCNVCERRFHDSSNLKKHKEIHNRVFRFQNQKPEGTFPTT